LFRIFVVRRQCEVFILVLVDLTEVLRVLVVRVYYVVDVKVGHVWLLAIWDFLFRVFSWATTRGGSVGGNFTQVILLTLLHLPPGSDYYYGGNTYFARHTVAIALLNGTQPR
jgi:hypothetical protein